jgi:hypothetical protein
VVAGTAIEQDRVAVGADQPGMDAGDQPIVAGRIMMRHQPVEMLRQHVAIETIEILFWRPAGEAKLLLDAGHRHVSDRPRRHCSLSSVVPCHHRERIHPCNPRQPVRNVSKACL